MTDKRDASVPPDGELPELSDVARIRDDLFYGFRSYHTPIGEQRALVEALIEAARLEGRASLADFASRDEVRSLFHRLWTSARGADAYIEAEWVRFAEILRTAGADVMSPPGPGGGVHEGGGG